jgi:hypothetical protein
MVSVVALVAAEEAKLQVLDMVARKVIAATVEIIQIDHSVESTSNMGTLSRDAGIDLMKTMFLSKGRRGTQLQL